jgi:hypothetical protein
VPAPAEVDASVPAEAPQALAPVTDALKEPAPTPEPPAADDSDAIVPVLGGSDGPSNDTLTTATDDTGLPALGDTLTTATDDTGLPALGDTLTTATDDTGLPALGDTLTTATDDTGLPAFGDALTTATDDGGLGDALTTATDTTLPALGDALTAATDISALGSLTHTVSGTTDLLTDQVSETLAPMVTTVDWFAAAPASAVQIDAPLTTTLNSLDGALGDTVAAITAPFAVTLPPADPQPAPAFADHGSQATPVGDSATDGSVAPGTQALIDGAAVTAAPAAAASGGDSLLNPEAVFGPGLAPPDAADPLMRLEAAAPDAVAGGPAIDQPGSILDVPGIVFGPAAGPSAIPDPGLADALSPTDSALAAIAEAAPDVRVLVSAAVLAMAAAAMVGPRASGSGADVSMVFTNVRLLPCVVKESLARHVEMLTAASGANGSGAVAISRSAELLGSSSGTRGASAEGTSSTAGRVRDALETALGSFRDGFEQAIGDERDDVGEAFRDSRLMMQIGMLLGFVYLGFLSVWFWATRVREASRPDAR